MELLADKGFSMRRELQECRQNIASLETKIKLSKPSERQEKQAIMLNEAPEPSGLFILYNFLKERKLHSFIFC